jgi:hypothetical protein
MIAENVAVSCHDMGDKRSPARSRGRSQRAATKLCRASTMQNPHSRTTSVQKVGTETGSTPVRGEPSSLVAVSTRRVVPVSAPDVMRLAVHKPADFQRVQALLAELLQDGYDEDDD